MYNATFSFCLKQLYAGISKNSILLKGIAETEDDEESIQDMIEIHFQKPSNGGGETDRIKYVSKGAIWVCFEEEAQNTKWKMGEQTHEVQTSCFI